MPHSISLISYGPNPCSVFTTQNTHTHTHPLYNITTDSSLEKSLDITIRPPDWGLKMQGRRKGQTESSNRNCLNSLRIFSQSYVNRRGLPWWWSWERKKEGLRKQIFFLQYVSWAEEMCTTPTLREKWAPPFSRMSRRGEISCFPVLTHLHQELCGHRCKGKTCDTDCCPLVSF